MATETETQPKITIPLAAGALAAITLCGFLLRLFHLGKESIWVDEGFTWRLSKLTLPQYIDNVLHTIRNVLPPLYFQLMHGWTALFGNSEFSLRFPSVLCGTLSIAGIYLLCKSLFNRETGIIAALLVAFSIFHSQYSQEARMYALLALLSIAAFYLLARFVRDNRWSSALLLGFVNVLLIYTHHYGFFIVFSEYVFAGLLCLLRRGYLRGSFTRWVALSGMSFALVAPWLYVFVNQARKVAKDPWLPAPNAASLLSLFNSYGGGLILLGLLLTPLAFWLLAKLFSSDKFHAKEEALDGRWYLLLLCWLLVPILCAFTYSIAVGPIFGNKYLIASSIPFYCLVARAASAIRFRTVKWALLAVVVGLSLLNAWRYYHAINKEQWREAAKFVESYAQPNDLALFNAGFGLENGFDYYSRRKDIVKKPFPARTVEVNTAVTPEDLDELLEAIDGHDRVWVIYSHGHDVDSLISNTLSGSYAAPYGSRNFVNIRVCLYVKGKG